MLRLLPLLLVSSGCAPEPLRPNVLIVSIDTLRADRLDRRDASGALLMPNLAAFSSSAAVFTNAWSQANETLYSHAALFTGKYASELAPIDYTRFTIVGTPTLASVFHNAGYRTEAIVAGGHLAPEFGLHIGFERYASGRDFGSFQQTVPLALERLDGLEDGEDPWLLFVHGYDVHAPYVNWGPLFRQQTPGYDGALLDASLVPWSFEQILDGVRYPGFSPTLVDRGDRTLLDPSLFDALERHAAEHPGEGERLTPADVAFIRGMYDASARYADYQVGVLLGDLERRGLTDETVVVILGDHGEDLMEHGHVNHRLSLHDENLHVPLLVRGPGVTPGTISTPVALVDVFPTLTALAGLEVPAGRGRSLLDPEPGRAIVSEAARGEISVRTEEGRLSVPRALGETLPATPPARAFVTGPSGEPVPWDAPLSGRLFSQLQAATR